MATMQNKRKRASHDMAGPRAAPAMNHTGNQFADHYLHTDHAGIDSTDGVMDFAAAFTQHGTGAADSEDQQNVGQMQGRGDQSASNTAAAAMAQYHTMTVPQSTEQSFMTQTAGDKQTDPNDQASPPNAQQRNSFEDFDGGATLSSQNGDASPTAIASNPNAHKPAVGTEEWHKVRRDNHKEVERRRRETINEGINELAKIVPGCEKNKGSILQRAVQFITQLKENETQNIEKWTLEKLLTEQAIAELSSSCDKLKAECQRAWAECEQWKKTAQKAGVSDDNDEKGDADAEDDD